MAGYSDGVMAVEFYKGEWILRVALAADLPLDPRAAVAMADWKARNRAKHEAGK